MITGTKYKLLKRTIAVLLLLFISFSAYVLILNRNSKEMTVRQKILRAVYPAFMWMRKKSATVKNNPSVKNTKPMISFYTLKATAIDGTEFEFTRLKGKKVLLVNTASDCGFTGQYDDLEKIYQTYKDKLVVIGFPANDFKEQEKGSDEDIAEFCRLNYGVSFPLMKKGTVIKNEDQQEVFKWLTDASKNGWNEHPPVWNFSKYLVSEEGILLNYFGPSVSPADKEIITAIENKE